MNPTNAPRAERGVQPAAGTGAHAVALAEVVDANGLHRLGGLAQPRWQVIERVRARCLGALRTHGSRAARDRVDEVHGEQVVLHHAAQPPDGGVEHFLQVE